MPNGNGLLSPLKNPLLSTPPGTLGSAPVTTAATQQKIDKHVAKMIDAESTLDVVTGQTRILVLKNTPFRVQVGDERYIGSINSTPREILIQGREVGTTVLNLWFGDKDDTAKQEVLTYLIRVYPDPGAKARLEASYKALESEVNKYFKECNVSLKLVGDKLIVSGRVRDFVQGGQILRVIRANMEGEAAKVPLNPNGSDPIAGTPALEQFMTAGGSNIINMLEVPGEQQVQLRVIVAEVNRAAARSVGMNFSLANKDGVTFFSNRTGNIGNIGGGGGGGGGGVGGFGIANITATLDAARIPLAIQALRTMEYARSLTDTNLVTLNGQSANFQAGGQFPVPIVQGNTFSGLQGVQFVPFGVLLNFTPFITDRDRIRVKLQATVSARDVGAGTNIGGANVAGLNTRNVDTTVELRQGETFAIAGLVETNLAAQANRVPFIGDLPYLTSLLGSQRVEAGEKELVIFITPELTRPLDPGQMPPLPGSEIGDPSDHEFYFLGRLETHCRDYRSPIRTDWSRIKQFQLIERANITGPSGYTPFTQP
ncbi:MAG: type II and III secretion system protein family protein [Gemmataceae bacterium]